MDSVGDKLSEPPEPPPPPDESMGVAVPVVWEADCELSEPPVDVAVTKLSLLVVCEDCVVDDVVSVDLDELVVDVVVVEVVDSSAELVGSESWSSQKSKN